MRILVDMDGVLAYYDLAFLQEWRRRHPDKLYVPLEERRNFYIDHDYPEGLRGLVDEILSSKGFYASLPPINGALEAMKEMDSLGIEAFICTRPSTDNKYCAVEKYEWVDRYLGRDWVRRMIITKDKTIVKGDYLIDDRPEVTGLDKPSWTHILYDQPYNRGISKPRITWENWKQYLLKNHT